MHLPNNPEKVPEKIRKNEGDSELEVLKDMRQILDRIRRNGEYMDGAVNQIDKSKRDSITIANGDTETLTVEAGENEFLYVAQAGVQPKKGSIKIKMDDEETQSNIDYRQDFKKAKKKAEIEINNDTGQEQTYDRFIDAKAVEVRN